MTLGVGRGCGDVDAEKTETRESEAEEMVQRLMSIMEREIDGVTVPRDDSGTDSIARLGLGSLPLIGFLVAVEDEFGIEWDSDIEVDVLRSFDAMAGYVLNRTGSPR
jgi:acyl carrier protein